MNLKMYKLIIETAKDYGIELSINHIGILNSLLQRGISERFILHNLDIVL